MGIPGLWKLIEPAGNSHESFTSLTVREGFKKRSRGRVFRLGIDASIWIKAVQCAHVSRHAQSGREPELRTLLYRLTRLLETCTQPVFVFDGRDRPGVKRGKHVRQQEHWMVDGFSKLVEAFGFSSHQAPAEAEAELARMNQLGLIDAVLTDDSDIFVFGATMVIRSSTYQDNDKGSIHTHTSSAIAKHRSVSLTRGGILLVALLCGGDYDKGLVGCGIKTAHALARYGFGDTLIEASMSLEGDEYAEFIQCWRAALCSTLTDDPRGLLGRSHRALANKLDPSFPNRDVIRLYTHPLVSSDTILCALELGGRTFDVEFLAELVQVHFDWWTDAPLKLRKLWGGIVYRELLQETLTQDWYGAGTETITPYAGLLQYSIKGFIHGTRCKLTVRNGILDGLIDKAQLATRGIRSSGRHVPPSRTRASAPDSIDVCIPTALIECARPAEVSAFRLKQGRATKGRQCSKQAAPSEIIDLTLDDDGTE